LRSFGFLFREFLTGLSQNRFLHFTYGAQVTISLLVLGIFFVLLIGAAVFWARIGAGIQMHVFLENDLTQQQLGTLNQEIAAIPHVSEVKFRSSEEAMTVFSKHYPNMPLNDLLDNNPLPASFIVKVDQPRNIKLAAQQCDNLDGVVSTHYASEVLDKYLKVLSILVIVCIATIALLVVFTYSSINNIISLSIYARRAEIRIMQLVGATWWFIRWPFIFEGVFFGMLGGALSLLVIWILMVALAQTLQATKMNMALPWLGLTEVDLFIGLGLLLLGLGATVGFFSSLKTVNGFLRVESDIQIDAQRVRQLSR
jgi:cell division transport system permease protein